MSIGVEDYSNLVENSLLAIGNKFRGNPEEEAVYHDLLGDKLLTINSEFVRQKVQSDPETSARLTGTNAMHAVPDAVSRTGDEHANILTGVYSFLSHLEDWITASAGEIAEASGSTPIHFDSTSAVEFQSFVNHVLDIVEELTEDGKKVLAGNLAFDLNETAATAVRTLGANAKRNLLSLIAAFKAYVLELPEPPATDEKPAADAATA